jgi:hypothetical protein
MPRKIDGLNLSDDEHVQWKSVYDETGNAAIATSAIQKRRKNTLKDLNEGTKMKDKSAFNAGARAKQITSRKRRNKAIMDELFPK